MVCSDVVVGILVIFIYSFLADNHTDPTVLDVFVRLDVLLHSLDKIETHFPRLPIGLVLKKKRLSIFGFQIDEGVVGFVVDLADRKEGIKFLSEHLPGHIEDSILLIFVVPVLHTFFLLGVDLVPDRILVIPP